ASTAAAHRFDRPPGRVDCPEKVRLQRLRPVFKSVASPGRRRVIDQDVKAADGCFRERDEGPRLGLSAHVRPEERRTSSGAFDHAHRFVATGLIDVAGNYGAASNGETSRNGATASGATSSSHNYYARVVQWSGHRAPYSILFHNHRMLGSTLF